MSSVHSSAEQGQEVLPCSSPLAVKRFSEERVSMRRSAKVTFCTFFASDNPTSYFACVSYGGLVIWCSTCTISAVGLTCVACYSICLHFQCVLFTVFFSHTHWSNKGCFVWRRHLLTAAECLQAKHAITFRIGSSHLSLWGNFTCLMWHVFFPYVNRCSRRTSNGTLIKQESLT